MSLHRRIFIALAGLLLGTVLAMPATAAAGSITPPAMAGYQQQLVDKLAGRRSTVAQLGAALLSRGLPAQPGKAGFRDFIARAAAATDAGPGVYWIQLLDCGGQDGTCPNQRALENLKVRAPNNAAVWLMVLASASRASDPQAMRNALAQAAHSKVFDDYSGVTLRTLARAVAAAPPPPALYGPDRAVESTAGVRVLLVLGLSSFQPLPGFQATAALCRHHANERAVRRQCLELAQILVHGTSPLALALGLHLQRTLTPDDAVRARAEARRHDLVWQIRQFGALVLASPQSAQVALRLLRLSGHARSRMGLILAALRASGIPVHAPAGWVPPARQAPP